MRIRNILIAVCETCDEIVFYDKTIQRFGHYQLPADFHPVIPTWVRSKIDDYRGRVVTKTDLISAESLYSLAYQPCWALPCGCGYNYDTEAEYANHFILSDPNQLNLGNCPI